MDSHAILGGNSSTLIRITDSHTQHFISFFLLLNYKEGLETALCVSPDGIKRRKGTLLTKDIRKPLMGFFLVSLREATMTASAFATYSDADI